VSADADKSRSPADASKTESDISEEDASIEATDDSAFPLMTLSVDGLARNRTVVDVDYENFDEVNVLKDKN
jgi:hypothetical protein